MDSVWQCLKALLKADATALHIDYKCTPGLYFSFLLLSLSWFFVVVVVVVAKQYMEHEHEVFLNNSFLFYPHPRTC